MRIKELQSLLKTKKIDLALFFNTDFNYTNTDLTYFSQYNGVGILAITQKNKFLIVPRMELKKAREGKVKVYKWKKDLRLFENVKAILKKKPKKIAINKNIFSLNAHKEFKKVFKKVKTIDISKDLIQIRKIKTKEEIKIIKQGCKISDKILNKCLKNFKKFKTESDVKAFLEHEAKLHNCTLAFPTIVASGKNAVKPHHETKAQKLNKGFCVIDFGIKYKNYCTDTTRTIYIGKPKKQEIKLYNIVLNTQKNIIKNIKLNKPCKELYLEAKSQLKPYAKYFTHGLGHGFGIYIHELPNLTDKSKDIIQNNMVFTIEPGIYFKNLGIRIEDDILIENSKIITLTKVTKELIKR